MLKSVFQITFKIITFIIVIAILVYVGSKIVLSDHKVIGYQIVFAIFSIIAFFLFKHLSLFKTIEIQNDQIFFTNYWTNVTSTYNLNDIKFYRKFPHKYENTYVFKGDDFTFSVYSGFYKDFEPIENQLIANKTANQKLPNLINKIGQSFVLMVLLGSISFVVFFKYFYDYDDVKLLKISGTITKKEVVITRTNKYNIVRFQLLEYPLNVFYIIDKMYTRSQAIAFRNELYSALQYDIYIDTKEVNHLITNQKTLRRDSFGQVENRINVYKLQHGSDAPFFDVMALQKVKEKNRFFKTKMENVFFFILVILSLLFMFFGIFLKPKEHF